MPEFDIYAEFGRGMIERADRGELELVLPRGVSMQHHTGSRACYFVCDDAETAQELIDWLDGNGIMWQDNSDVTLEMWKIKEKEKKYHGR